MTSVTPHDIAVLADTRRRDPKLAMDLATQSGRQSDLNANNPVKAAMTRLYRYRNGLLEAAWEDDPERWSVLLLPSLLSMTPDELRHVAGVIDEGRARMEEQS